MNAPTQALHNRVDAVLALAASRLDAQRAQAVESVAREYFNRVDPDDLAERTPEDLLGTLLSHLQLGDVREPGRPKVRIFAPTPGEDGWTSRHTVIQIVNDDMPFLVDSTSLEINRQGLMLHLIVHPIFAVERDAKGKLLSIGANGNGRAHGVPRESWMHIEVDRLVDNEQRDALAAGIERVLADVRAAVIDWRPMLDRLREAIVELGRAPASLPQAVVVREPCLPAVAGRRPHHAAGLPPARPGAGGRRGGTAAGARQRAGPVARNAGRKTLRQLRGPARPGAGAGQGAAARAGGDQGQHALHGASRRLHRLHRRQALQRRGRGDRRAPLHRPVHVHRVQRAGRRNAAAARQGRGHRHARGPAARRPPVQGARPHPGNLSARRAVPDPRRGAVRDGAGHRRPGRAPAPAPVHVARSVRPLRLLHGLRAARGLLHRPADQVPAHPAVGAGRHQRGVRRAAQRRGAGAHPLHRAHQPGTDPAVRAQGPGAQACRRGAPLGRRVARQPGRGGRRGRGPGAVQALERGVSGRLPRPRPGPRRRARRAQALGRFRRIAAAARALPAARRRGRRRSA